jgi:hypothetical protein
VQFALILGPSASWDESWRQLPGDMSQLAQGAKTGCKDRGQRMVQKIRYPIQLPCIMQIIARNRPGSAGSRIGRHHLWTLPISLHPAIVRHFRAGGGRWEEGSPNRTDDLGDAQMEGSLKSRGSDLTPLCHSNYRNRAGSQI